MSPLTLKLGRLVRVILLAIICDHPAMCKVSGFADHAHNMAPCTKCQVTQAELFSEKSLRNGMYLDISQDYISLKPSDTGFPARDGAVHRARCFHYRTLT